MRNGDRRRGQKCKLASIAACTFYLTRLNSVVLKRLPSSNNISKTQKGGYPMPDIIHILNEAKFPLCGYISTPSDTTWPMGHRWTPEKENATCARCRRAAGLKVTTEHWLDGIKEI